MTQHQNETPGMAAFAAQKDSGNGSVCLSTMGVLNTYVQLQSHGTNSGWQQQIPCTISFPVENHTVLCLGFLYVGFPWNLVNFRNPFWKSSGRSSENPKPTIFPVLPGRAHECRFIGCKTPSTIVSKYVHSFCQKCGDSLGRFFLHSPLSQRIIQEKIHLDL